MIEQILVLYVSSKNLHQCVYVQCSLLGDGEFANTREIARLQYC